MQLGGVGDPALRKKSTSQSFLGFSVREVSVESKSFQCQTRSCLGEPFPRASFVSLRQTSTPGSQVGLGLTERRRRRADANPAESDNGVLQTSLSS